MPVFVHGVVRDRHQPLPAGARPLLVTAVGFEPLITHPFEEGAQYLDNDVVFGTMEQLVVPFLQRDPGSTPEGGQLEEPWIEARYDFVLQPRS